MHALARTSNNESVGECPSVLLFSEKNTLSVADHESPPTRCLLLLYDVNYCCNHTIDCQVGVVYVVIMYFKWFRKYRLL